ncbi:MAG: signal peptidase I [Patescibacteria group bacterium]
MEQQPVHKKALGFFSDTLQTFGMALAVFLVIYFIIARPFQVSGDSMFPTYKDKEYIFTNIIGLKMGHLNKGDVIVFKAPVDSSKDFIKRVIGMNGDTVEIKEGSVYVNGERLNEQSYLSSDVKTFGGTFLPENAPKKVPTGEIFVMGDNRANSSDSREWGFLKKSEVIGKSFFVYWPISEAHAISNPYK